MYGGRLGLIIKMYPRVNCGKCDTVQVQITSYLAGDPEYKCRLCKHTFTLPFRDGAGLGADDGQCKL